MSSFPNSRHLLAALWFAWVMVAPAQAAEAVDALWQRLQPIDSLSARFVQTVHSSDGSLVQENQGQLDVRRPALLRWQSELPFREQVVIDGERIWFHDEDLAQVTVRAYQEDLRQLPALIFGSSREQLAAGFDISQNGADTFRLVPRDLSGFVQTLVLRWQGEQPVELQVEDNLGNRTRLQLSTVRLNTIQDNSLFHFQTPPGASVLDETRESVRP